MKVKIVQFHPKQKSSINNYKMTDKSVQQKAGIYSCYTGKINKSKESNSGYNVNYKQNVSKPVIKNSRNNYSFAQYYNNLKPNTSKSKFKSSKQYKGFRSTKD